MKRFLVNIDNVIRLFDAPQSMMIAVETVFCEDYVLHVKTSCEMDAATILRHIAVLDGFIPHSIYYTLRRKLEDVLARIKDNDTRIKLRDDISGSFYIANGCWVGKGEKTKVSDYILTPAIVKVMVNGPATIIFWADGTKSVVKCQDDEEFDLEKGIAMCFARKALGNENKYHKHIRKAVKMAEDYIEEHAIDTESSMENVYINRPLDQFSKEVNRTIKEGLIGIENILKKK